MAKPEPLTLKRAIEEGRLAEFAKQHAHLKGSKAKLKRLIGRASNAPRRPKTSD
jgi:hypothetical protein